MRMSSGHLDGGLPGSFSSLRWLSYLLLMMALLLTAAACSAHTPFTGTPMAIPGTINAVDYDKGTQGDAYNIQQPSTSGSYRADDANGPVAVNPINQYGTPTGNVVGGNGYVVGNHIVQGDWLVYTVSVASSGYYDIQVNAAPAQAGRQVDFQLDGTDVTPGNLTLATTSGWGNFGVATYPAAYLTAGTHTLKMLVADPNAIFVLNTYTFTSHVVHTFYVSSSTGSDGNPGTQAAPFATVAKAESQSLNSGDSVLFLRGDTWHEVLNPLASGTPGNPITFADYGNAANPKPKFWGSNQIPVNDGQWTSQGGNVYTHPYAQQVNSVLANQKFLIDIFNGGTGDGSVVRDPTNTPNCWKWSGGVLTISTNGTNPNTDGRQYGVCVRDNVICNGNQITSTYSSNLVFRNLVVDECGSNQNPSLGYGLRIEGDGVNYGVNILVDGCEVYRYGRHGFAVIDGSNVTFNNCYCAYPMPNVQTGQTGYVSFGNTGPNLSETSVYNNCVAEHQADTWPAQAGTGTDRSDFEYEAFTDHGGSLKSVTLNNFRAIDTGGDGAGDNCTFDGASGAAVTVTGGTCYSAQVNTLGPNVLVNGMNITGSYAGMDIAGNYNIIENCVIAGTVYGPPYNSAVWIRNDGNIFRFNTVATDPSSGNGFSALSLSSLGSSYGTNAQVYGNTLLANQLSINTFTSANTFSAANVRDNVYTSGATFQLNYGTVWSLPQWQAQGYDAGSIQVANPDAALFTNATGGDYSLKAGSPAIDLVPTSVPHPPTDILGNGRPHGAADDAGAYEYGGAASSVPVITSGGTASGTVGTAFGYQISATNSPTSFGASGLPTGLSVNTATGVLSGTPTTAGTSSATITATNAAGTGSGMVSITIAPAAPQAPVINSATSATGTAGSAFSYQISATNSPTSFGASGLPAGLSVSTATGVISGTPTAAGVSTVTLSAANAGGTGTATLTLTVNPAAATESPYGGTAWPIPGKVEAENYDLGGEGVAYHDNDPQNIGGAYRNDGVDIRSVVSDAGGGYQVGWTNTGEYLNYTVNVTASGTYQFQARVASGSTGGSLHFNVDGTNVTGPMAVPGTGSYDTFTTISSGTVTLTAGKHIVQLYEDADNGYDINWFNVVAGGTASKPVINSATTASGMVGTALSYQITASNSPTSYGASGLPAGLSVNTATGLISGTPTAAGVSTVTLSATNAGGTGTATLTITVSSPAGGYNVFALWNPGSTITNGGSDSYGNGYNASLVGTTATYAGTSLTLGPANAADAYSGVTVPLPAGTYTQLNMIGSAVGGTVTGQVFVVNYTDGTTQSFTQSLSDWASSNGYAGETILSTQATRLIQSGASGTPGTLIYGYTFALNGKSVKSITLPNTRQVIAFGFTTGTGGAPSKPVINSATSATGTAGSAFTYQITASNSPTSYGASGLPAGLSVNTSTGVLSGTPTAAGVSTVTLSATNAGGTGSATLTLTVSSPPTPYNVYALWTPGTALTNGGADSYGNGYNASLVGTSLTYSGSTFTLGPANAADAWSSVTVSLPAGTYTKLSMLGTAVGGIVTGQVFVVNYTDGTTQSFNQSLSDWSNIQAFAGETVVATQATRLLQSGATATPGTYVYGYTFALNGKPVKSITLPATRQVIAFGFAGHN